MIKGSPLEDVFAAWGGRLRGGASASGGAPPDAETMVVPDPERLRGPPPPSCPPNSPAKASPTRSWQEVSPGSPTRRWPALREFPLAGAVDIVNQERYLQENRGPCRWCAHPVSPDHNPVEPPDEVYVEP